MTMALEEVLVPDETLDDDGPEKLLHLWCTLCQEITGVATAMCGIKKTLDNPDQGGGWPPGDKCVVCVDLTYAACYQCGSLPTG